MPTDRMNRRPTNQDITWFLDHRRNGQINLDPPYQRRSVWTRKDRLFFLDTVFRGLPSPAVFLHKTVNEDGVPTYHVVDGKQRLETIFLFVDDKLRIADDFGDARLTGKRWSELDLEAKKLLWNYSVPVEFVDFSDTTMVKNVFDRLNRNVKKLERQELRHARHSGWFATFVEEEVANPDWRHLGLSTAARERRMADAQFLSELLLVILTQGIAGFDQTKLDENYAVFDAFDQDDEEEAPPSSLTIDEFRGIYVATLDFLKTMMHYDESVRRFTRTLANLYTLWSVLVLHRAELQDPTALTSKYVD